MARIQCEVTEKPLDVNAGMQTVSDPAHGAVDTFLGVVRNTHDGHEVTGITYDVHESLARATFETIAGEIRDSWPETHVYIAHRQGYCAVGEASVLIAVSSPHRAESFDACRYAIEEIKKRAPIWKQEHYTDGASDWLPGHSLRLQTGDA